MLTVADMGEGGAKNLQKSADVLYGRSLDQLYVTVGQNNFGNKILSFEYFREIIGCKSPFLLQGPHFSPTLP